MLENYTFFEHFQCSVALDGRRGHDRALQKRSDKHQFTGQLRKSISPLQKEAHPFGFLRQDVLPCYLFGEKGRKTRPLHLVFNSGVFTLLLEALLNRYSKRWYTLLFGSFCRSSV